MKFIFLTILSAIIFFFVWNILKRLFFKQFYQNTINNFDEKKKEKNNKIHQKINWDAETIDYEEVADSQNNKK